MNILIRADASVEIGSGHIMRCLALADGLRTAGARVAFVCRQAPGDLSDVIAAAGYPVHRLDSLGSGPGGLDEDAAKTISIIDDNDPLDWLIVDHYALDRRWESALRSYTKRIMVIDDLANRPHECDVLLDQNLDSPRHRNYTSLIPAGSTFLAGTTYALVRSEFVRHRERSLARRDGKLDRLLVFMGGSDPDNDTAKVLAGLETVSPGKMAIDVVIGSNNPHRNEIQIACARLPGAILHVQTPHMAELMTAADCAITASGSTTWERCVLGLPALAVLQSEDQSAIATAVDRAGGHQLLGWAHALNGPDYARAITALTPDRLRRMSSSCATLCDGNGTSRVADYLLREHRSGRTYARNSH